MFWFNNYTSQWLLHQSLNTIVILLCPATWSFRPGVFLARRLPSPSHSLYRPAFRLLCPVFCRTGGCCLVLTSLLAVALPWYLPYSQTSPPSPPVHRCTPQSSHPPHPAMLAPIRTRSPNLFSGPRGLYLLCQVRWRDSRRERSMDRSLPSAATDPPSGTQIKLPGKGQAER